MPRTLTLSDARNKMSRSKAWTFRLECTTGGSSKFWLATGRGRNEPVEVHYGKIGGRPQIIVKDWAYVEAKVPEKLTRQYGYAPTPFIRVRQSTINAHQMTSNALATPQVRKPAPNAASQVLLQPPPNKPTPKPAAAPKAPSWRCNVGGVSMRIKGTVIEVEFDTFPADWQGAVYHTFKDDLENFCTHEMRRKVGTWWGGDHGQLFHVRNTDQGLFDALVKWFQRQIGAAATPRTPAPALAGPYGKVVCVKPVGKGAWHALSAMGDKVLDLTARGARDLVAAYPHIKVAGL